MGFIQGKSLGIFILVSEFSAGGPMFYGPTLPLRLQAKANSCNIM